MWVNHPVQVSQLGQLSLSSLRGRQMSSRPVYRMCAEVAPSGEYLRGHGRVAVDITALRRLWQHLSVLGLVILACVPVYAVVVAVCQLLIKTIIIIIIGKLKIHEHKIHKFSADIQQILVQEH